MTRRRVYKQVLMNQALLWPSLICDILLVCLWLVFNPVFWVVWVSFPSLAACKGRDWATGVQCMKNDVSRAHVRLFTMNNAVRLSWIVFPSSNVMFLKSSLHKRFRGGLKRNCVNQMVGVYFDSNMHSFDNKDVLYNVVTRSLVDSNSHRIV